VKFFLHLSKQEQARRFLARVEDPEKNWKFSAGDLAERRLWKEYRSAYEACLSATSTKFAPWYVVPADDKQNARLIISRVIVDTLDSLEMSYPKTDQARRRELREISRMLKAEIATG
jgi:polyphosphate kinase 2 (PPK2 family)